ncbi:MAG: hypothetical protein KAX18_03480 [Candidatus Lokiarchaeota archaeon]|nr:hypothetical protein [Candidatus Lokiarchaeota archaeon]
MAKKKSTSVEEDDLEIPKGKMDEDGDEVIDLEDWKDNLEDDIDYDLDKIKDDMLEDETEEESVGYDIDEVEALMREVKCAPCKGSSSKRDCKVRDDFGCPPDKAKL